MWWVGGVPLLLVMAALGEYGKDLFLAGHPGWANFAGLMRFALFFGWFLVAWNCSQNAGRAAWTWLARAMLAAGLVLTALT